MQGRLESADPLDERRFLVVLKRLADSLAYGAERSPFLGGGIEYAQSRPYEPGDPVKSIDWRVTARAGRVYVKEYEAPKRSPSYFLVDTSASMTVGSATPSKYAWAVRLAGGLALARLAGVSPVGLLGTGERELRVEPSLSRGQVYQWALRLRDYRFDERTTLARRVRELGAALGSRALVVVLSDLHDPDAVPALKLLARAHETVVLQLQDPAELGVSGAGFFRGREAETGAEFFTRGRWEDPSRAGAELVQAGVDHLLLRIDEPFLPRLSFFLRSRAGAGKGAR
jgi:uncharacterized protein (DUF58 family)